MNTLVLQEKSNSVENMKNFSAELYEKNLEQIKSFVENVEHNINDIINKVFIKLGVYNVSAEQIANIIRAELLAVIQNKAVKIIGNADTIKYFAVCIDFYGLDITYIEDGLMPDGVCKINDGVCVTLVDVANAAAKIKEIFESKQGLLV